MNGLIDADLGHSITPEKLSLFSTRHSCSLRSHMEKLAASNQRFSRLQVCRYAQQIASGLAFLHRQSVLHRDLKVRFHHRLARECESAYLAN